MVKNDMKGDVFLFVNVLTKIIICKKKPKIYFCFDISNLFNSLQ